MALHCRLLFDERSICVIFPCWLQKELITTKNVCFFVFIIVSRGLNQMEEGNLKSGRNTPLDDVHQRMPFEFTPWVCFCCSGRCKILSFVLVSLF